MISVKKSKMKLFGMLSAAVFLVFSVKLLLRTTDNDTPYS